MLNTLISFSAIYSFLVFFPSFSLAFFFFDSACFTIEIRGIEKAVSGVSIPGSVPPEERLEYAAAELEGLNFPSSPKHNGVKIDEQRLSRKRANLARFLQHLDGVLLGILATHALVPSANLSANDSATISIHREENR